MGCLFLEVSLLYIAYGYYGEDGASEKRTKQKIQITTF